MDVEAIGMERDRDNAAAADVHNGAPVIPIFRDSLAGNHKDGKNRLAENMGTAALVILAELFQLGLLGIPIYARPARLKIKKIIAGQLNLIGPVVFFGLKPNKNFT